MSLSVLHQGSVLFQQSHAQRAARAHQVHARCCRIHRQQRRRVLRRHVLQIDEIEYFTLSRLGIVSWMSVLTGPLGFSGEWAMRLTTWMGFAALATSSFVLTRRWASASSFACVVALLLIPGLAESSFFYNDTIFAAALSVTALAVISTSPSAAAVATSGVLFGTAIVARLDAILLAPAVLSTSEKVPDEQEASHQPSFAVKV
jgi:Gpi18-like mannosyltransferase